MHKSTMRTLADRVGVSVMTVSNAYSRPDQLSGALRERILRVADEIGYAGPNPTARSLSRGQTNTVGIFRGESAQYSFEDEHSTALLAGIIDELGRRGRALTLLPAVGSGSTLSVRDVLMDGAIMHSAPTDPTDFEYLARRVPIVQLDQEPRSDVPSVNIDDRGGARAAAQHLLDLGHTRIAYVSLTQDNQHNQIYPALQRVAGWTGALHEAGLEPCAHHVPESTVDFGCAVFTELIAHDPPPTAVLAVSDAIAAGIMQAARQAGLKVPQQLSVVGFDDMPIASRVSPPLTTVAQDVTEKGRIAVDVLVSAIESNLRGKAAAATSIVLPTHLVVRKSTAAPPRTAKAVKNPKGH